MKKNECFLIVLLIISLFLSVVTNTQKIIAEEDTGTIVIIKSINNSDNMESSNIPSIEGSRYGLIRINEKIDFSVEQKQKIAGELQSKSLKEIENMFSSLGSIIISNPTDEKGKTTINSLKYGNYYVVEVKKTNENWEVSKDSIPLIVSVFKSSTSITVRPKNNVPGIGSEQIELPVMKKWIGDKLSEVQIYLYGNGNKIDEIELNESNKWKYVFKNLKKYDNKGKIIEYTVKENVPDGYISKVEKDENIGGFLITNTKAFNNVDKTNIHTKDNSNIPGKGGTIIKTGDNIIYFILGLGIIIMGIGYKVYNKTY